MNRIILLVLALVVVFSAVSMAQISGTKHNLSTGGTLADKSTNETQVCIFCHTPHQTGITATPLWNHTASAVANYGMYNSSTLNASDIADIGGGTGTSNLCMSCHDGTIAVNSLGNTSTVGTPTMGTTGTELDATTHAIKAGRSANLGNSLANDHPINFTYNSTLATADGGLKTPVSGNYVDAASKIPLFGAKMQCATCHEAHDNTNAPFLVVSNTGSALCTSCHNK